MFFFDYPKVKHSLWRAALEDPYPAWYLDTRGVISAANLMAFWLWDALEAGEPIKADALLGKSIFSIFAHHFERIPVDQNGEFYAKKSAIVKRMNAEVGSDAILYASFIAAMKADPRLESIYGQAILYPDNEWENPLRIMPPGLSGSTDFDSGLLEFQVTVYRFERNTGFLATYIPTPTTLPAFEEMYSLLAGQYGDKVYMQSDDMEGDAVQSNQLPTNFEDAYRTYYPTIIHDPLWYITGENKAQRLLVGVSVVGMHFFELFFAPQLRQWLGPLQETSAPRAIRYFDMFTVTYLRDEHELHAEYEQTMKYLLQLQDFRDLLEISRKLNIRLNLPDNSEAPFYTCRVILPMALILLLLASTAQALDEDDKGYTPSFMQFIWLLTVVKTVKEGLTRDGGEEDEDEDEDWRWEPESAFGRIHEELAAKFREDQVDGVIAEFREISRALDDKGIVDKGVLLGMLYSFTGSMRQLDQLGVFLGEEIERHRGVMEKMRVES